MGRLEATSKTSACRSLVALVVAPLFAAITARADLSMTLNPALQYGARGTEIVFSGTLVNTSGSAKVYLNDITFVLNGDSSTHLAPESNYFFADVPGVLLPGESYTSGEIFRVLLGAAAPLGNYDGTVSLLGGTDMATVSTLASTGFTVSETPLENWRVQMFGLDADKPGAADLADFDGDGMENLLEYALNFDPRIADNKGLPAGVASGGFFTLSYLPNAIATDLSFIVESSTDLLNWGTDNVDDISNPNPNPPGLKTFRYHVPMSLSAPAFLRLRVTRLNP